MNRQLEKRRCIISFAIIMCVLIYAVGYLINWQLIRGEEMSAKVSNNSLKTTVLTSERGTIYDATGTKILAQSAAVWTVTLEPLLIEKDKREIIADELSAILNLDRDDIYEKTQKKSYFVYLKRKVEDDIRQQILDMMEEYNITSGIRLISDFKRYYPYGTTAASVIGFTGTDNEGLTGIELQYNNELSGTAGRMVSLKNGVGGDMPFQQEQLVEAENGYDLVLTIDETIQSIVEKHLREGVERYGAQKGATAVLMDVNTGGIIALAEGDTFDLNDPFTVYDDEVVAEIELLPSEEEQQIAYNEALYTQWRNKAVSDTYYPGSVSKMVTVAAALDSGAITEDTTFNCTGSYKPWVDHSDGSKTVEIDCWRSRGHGVQNARAGLCNSCNPFMMQTAEKMGSDMFFDYFSAFGFTEKTNIDLPGESNSIYYDKESLGPVELATESFGQNFSITPIQMITAACAVANGGYIVQPHLIQRMIDQDGNIVETSSASYKRQVISDDVSAMLTDYMLENATTGTGKTGYVPGYRVVGKTGTSEKIAEYNNNPDPNKEMTYVVSYCGYAPAEDPQYALLVYFDTPTIGKASGGQMAGPVFANIMSEVLPYLEVETKITDQDYEYNVIYAPNVVGETFADAKKRFEEIGLNYEIYGSDMADTDIINLQIPSGSTAVPRENGKIIISKESSYPEYDMVSMPDFSGYSVNDCLYLARINELQIIITGMTASGNGTAQNQNIPVGTMVRKDSVVEVAVVDFAGLE